jgi:hypothetical protein
VPLRTQQSAFHLVNQLPRITVDLFAENEKLSTRLRADDVPNLPVVSILHFWYGFHDYPLQRELNN